MAVNRLGKQELRNIQEKPESGGDDATGRDPATVRDDVAPTSPLPDFTGGPIGSVLYRGVSDWRILGPGNNGQVLSSQGAGNDPKWIDPPLTAAAGGRVVTLIDTNPTYVRELSLSQPISLTDANPTYTTAVNDP